MATSPQGGPSIRKKLDSWKQIAGYLNVSVRTVQRWEAQCQLPVHRAQRDRGAAIFAFSDEIDEWYRSRVQSPGTDALAPRIEEAVPINGEGPRPRLDPNSLESSARSAAGSISHRWLMIGTASAAVVAAMFLVWFRFGGPVGPVTSQVLTVEPGAEWSPALSPDGQKLLFVWGRGDEFGVAYQSPPGGRVHYLRRGTDVEYSPQWLPDGRRFVWLRFRADFRAELWMGSRDDPGAARSVAAVDGVLWLDPIRFGPYLQVLPGGEAVILTGQAGRAGPSTLERVDLATGQRERLRTDPRRIHSIALSPGGTRLMAVFQEGDRSGIEEFRLTANGRIASGPTPVSSPGSVNGIAWGPDGDLVRLAIDGLFPPEVPRRAAFSISRGWFQRPIHLADRPPLAHTFSVGLDRYLYWSDLRFDTSLRRWNPVSRQLSDPICDSSTMERMPNLAPDGRRVAFVSNRSGGTNIFACDMDRGEVTPLTRYPYSFTWRPKWSPSGREVGYIVNEIGQPSRVEVAPAAGGAARNWSEGILGRPADFAWAADGQGLYIISDSKIFHRLDPQAAPALISGTTASRIQPRADGSFWLLDQGQLVLWDPRTGDRRVVDRATLDLAQLDVDGRSIYAARKARAGPFGVELWRHTDVGGGTKIAPDLPKSMGWHGGPGGVVLAVIAEQTEAAIHRAGPLP